MDGIIILDNAGFIDIEELPDRYCRQLQRGDHFLNQDKYYVVTHRVMVAPEVGLPSWKIFASSVDTPAWSFRP